MVTNIYHAFLSYFDKDDAFFDKDGEFDDMDIEAINKEDARERLAKHFAQIGAKVDLSKTSEEVIVTLQNEDVLVYYGFDLD